MGTAALVVVLAVSSAGAPLVVAGAFAYVAGAFVVTRTVNVPLNNELAAVDAHADDRQVWRRFCTRWTVWNHVRSLAALAASVLLALA